MTILTLFSLKVILCLNAVFGYLALEWAWNKFRRFRNPNSKLSDLYPGLRRDDCPRWQKWKFIPGAVFFLVPRILLIAASPILAWIPVKIAMLGHEKGTPITGIRKRIVQFAISSGSKLVLFSLATRPKFVNLTSDEVDNYKKYLGSIEE